MNEKELNKKLKKLAEWAGFTQNYFRDMWYYPNGDPVLIPLGEVFQSLDACFKWLVPKVADIKIHTGSRLISYAVVSNRIDKNYNATGETLALALCKAIEGLIDNEV